MHYIYRYGTGSCTIFIDMVQDRGVNCRGGQLLSPIQLTPVYYMGGQLSGGQLSGGQLSGGQLSRYRSCTIFIDMVQDLKPLVHLAASRHIIGWLAPTDNTQLE